MNINTHQLKDMVGEILRHNDEVTFQVDGEVHMGTIMEFKGLFVRAKTKDGNVFILSPSDVMTDRGAEAEVRRAQ